MYGCANAIGNSIPPYFIFKGIRFSPELLKWVSKGTKATMSESGWSNAKIFKQYLQEHFLPFARPDVADSQGRDYSQTILLIYDGHTSHVKPAVIEWGKLNNFILFVLPPHTSHLFQPYDIVVFVPFKSFYHSECSLFMERNMGRKITRYDTCELACKAYMKAFTPNNNSGSFPKDWCLPCVQDGNFCRKVVSIWSVSWNIACKESDGNESRKGRGKKISSGKVRQNDSKRLLRKLQQGWEWQ